MTLLQPRGWAGFSLLPLPGLVLTPHRPLAASQMEGGLGLQLRLRGKRVFWLNGVKLPSLDPACCRDGPGTEALRSRAVSQKRRGVGTDGVLSPLPCLQGVPL